MHRSAYLSLLSQARRLSRRADEAEDLLHTVLLSAVQAGRADLNQPQNRKWLRGALSKRAAHEARSGLRRRTRETAFHTAQRAPTPPDPHPETFISTLPTSLRATALLALTGHTRVEIAYLLGVSNPALRQRIAQIKQRWRNVDGAPLSALSGLNGPLPYGLIRRALHKPVAQSNAHLGSHDPDGHLFMLKTAHKTAPRGNL